MSTVVVPLRAELGQHGEDQLTLMLGAGEVTAAQMTGPGERQRFPAVHVSRARIEERPGVLVGHGHVDVDCDPADVVDQLRELIEADTDHVRDRHTDQPSDGIGGRLRTVAEGFVDLAQAVPGDVDPRVARNVDHDSRAAPGGDADDMDGVRATTAGTRS